MRIAIVTDAWEPQVNGVVTTLCETRNALRELGHTVRVFSPLGFRSLPCPTYPEIRLSLFPKGRLIKDMDAFRPDCIHIATEGPLGAAARSFCIRKSWPFTTSYHTQFPQYVRERLPIPLSWSYAYLRHFHGPAARTMVASDKQRQDLIDNGFESVVMWSRGVDTDLFKPSAKDFLNDPRPIWMNVGRVAIEKNLPAFLELDLPGTKYVVGDGPSAVALRDKYPGVRFVGYKFGDELAGCLAAADVFVFPSRTDTFGLVMLEAMACGVPVAAYPVTGPIDVVTHGETGCLSEDLTQAARDALTISPSRCREEALKHTWEACTRQFVSHLAPIKQDNLTPAPV